MQWKIACAVMAMSWATTVAQSVPNGFVVETLVATGLPTPHDFGFLPDGRVLIGNKAGEIFVYANGATAAIGTVTNVETSYERGLLSVVADPGFASNGYIYTFYSRIGDSFLHLDRYTCSGDLANPASTNLQVDANSRRALLDSLADFSVNHNGGSLRFGPDGMLYLACGDDGSACNAQNLQSQAGWLMRLDISNLPAGGSLLAPPFATLSSGDNPLSANADHTQLMIAHGLRNPWRMSIDPVTGNLYVADVGAFQQEEVSEYVRPGSGTLPLQNFGWPWFEGTVAFSACGATVPPGLVTPIVTVPNSAWQSILAGPRYRAVSGAVFDFGGSYNGDLFYADHLAGEVRRLVRSGSWGPAPAVAGQPTAADWGTGFDLITSLQQGPDGALYFTQHPGSFKRVRPIGAGNAVAAISGSGQRATSGEAFAEPVLVRVFDSQGNPVANASVTFTVTGPASVASANPVMTDALGNAQASLVTDATAGGAVTVTATTPSAQTSAPFGLFVRRLTVTTPPLALRIDIVNETDFVPPIVPHLVLVSFPGSPSLPTPFGTLCIQPDYPLAFVLEDGFGVFGGGSLSGTGGLGTPGLTLTYPLPPGLLTGQLLTFQAAGFDGVTGLFLTNCEQQQF